MMKQIAAVAALTLALGFAGTTAALADEAPPIDPAVVETPAVVDEPADEAAPADAAPADPAPEADPPAEETAPAPAALVANVKLPICHSGSGNHWTYIAPDANGYNGHQHHDADIYGLTEAECLAKNVVDDDSDPQPVDVDYTTVAWVAPGGAPPHHFDVPQIYLFSENTDDPSLNTLDDNIASYGTTLKCGTTADIQIDVYTDDSTTVALIAGSELDGPNNPTEHLIAGGEGTAWKFVHIEARACAPVGGSFTPSYDECTGPGQSSGYSGTLTLDAGTTAVYSIDGVDKGAVGAGHYTDADFGPGTVVITLTGEDGSTLVLGPFDFEKLGYADCLVVVTPDTVTAQDKCGVDNDTVILPTDETEFWLFNTTDNRVDGVGTVRVEGWPPTGYTVGAPGEGDTYTVEEGVAVWTFDFTNEACPTPVVPTVPVALASTGGGIAPNIGVSGVIMLIVTGLALFLGRKRVEG